MWLRFLVDRRRNFDLIILSGRKVWESKEERDNVEGGGNAGWKKAAQFTDSIRSPNLSHGTAFSSIASVGYELFTMRSLFLY